MNNIRLDPILHWINTAKPEWGTKIPSLMDKILIYNLVTEEAEELRAAMSKDKREEIIDSIVDCLWMLLNAAVLYGIDGDEIQQMSEKILISNQSKFCKTEQECKDTLNAYKCGAHPDKPGISIECIFRKVGDNYVVFRERDDKILKSINYKKVQDL